MNNDFVKIGLVILVIFLVFKLVSSKESLDPTLSGNMPLNPNQPTSPMTATDLQTTQMAINPLMVPMASTPEIMAASVSSQMPLVPSPNSAVVPSDLKLVVAGPSGLTTDELLPKYDQANDFVKQNPVSDLLKEQNFLISGYHVGINTVLQSSKIPYYDLRSIEPIPKSDLGPFNNSTLPEPVGSNRRHFELGSY
jgi:hypothetical protein